jgi:phosphate starvation-inducible membrane PsiE
MEFLGVSLADILTNYLSNQVHISMQFGVYLVAAGLVGLIIGGLLRLLVAARESA